MTASSGIIVVNRADLLRLAMRSGSLTNRLPATGGDHNTTFLRYRGFDGVVWPEPQHPEFQTEGGVASLADLTAVEAYIQHLVRQEECDLIGLRAELGQGAFATSHWRSIGFDIGYFESESSHFSVILNEVVYGTSPEMIRCASLLNNHLLCPSREQGEEILASRRRAERLGADLERIQNAEIIEIFVPLIRSH
jgi:hypothetical protein